MRLDLVPRPEPSGRMALLSPVIATVLTLAIGAALFLVLGVDPARGLYVYFVEPLTAGWSLVELVVKAAPLALIAVGLALCFRANVWNIGAEGQFTIGAVCGSAIPVLLPDWQSPAVLPLMLLLGLLGGALYGAVPAVLKNRFGASEILTSLMLTYVALLLLDWLVRGPWRDPGSYNFPESVLFSSAATMPVMGEGSRLHWGVLFAPLAALLAYLRLGTSVQGFAIKVTGAAPRAARFSGFSGGAVTLGVFVVSGALAGLAGIVEVAGTIGQLRPTISPGYGFAAIIVAFVGRLHPLGILVAALLLALTYLGGEGAQVTLGLSANVTRLFQGLLLVILLGCDTLIAYRIRFERRGRPAAGEASRG
ncbi:ABC transporter permease [Propylenella binzhouense]|uniref:ABC transporter permease n=1 Tax=Propylenella binzhouense TaxID=2555902 RepID=A0A964T6I3_9HYPH|nr:ABC transporter permease [Propylenella binzhouense]MYZ49393.1 ABC transporter permease [Propylenella binzhouense]